MSSGAKISLSINIFTSFNVWATLCRLYREPDDAVRQTPLWRSKTKRGIFVSISNSDLMNSTVFCDRGRSCNDVRGPLTVRCLLGQGLDWIDYDKLGAVYEENQAWRRKRKRRNSRIVGSLIFALGCLFCIASAPMRFSFRRNKRR